MGWKFPFLTILQTAANFPQIAFVIIFFILEPCATKLEFFYFYVHCSASSCPAVLKSELDTERIGWKKVSVRGKFDTQVQSSVLVRCHIRKKNKKSYPKKVMIKWNRSNSVDLFDNFYFYQHNFEWKPIFLKMWKNSTITKVLHLFRNFFSILL